MKFNSKQTGRRPQYTGHYSSPLGEILLSADELGLTGLWFEGQKYYARGLDESATEMETDILKQARKWLDIYFSGREPDISVPLHPAGTKYQQEVWALLLDIPYGHTVTYGELAGLLNEKGKDQHTSARAVGGAVGHNPISIMIPCHRVLGSGGSLTGYAGGVEKKLQLLRLEKPGS